jgi:hypothetical protein
MRDKTIKRRGVSETRTYFLSLYSNARLCTARFERRFDFVCCNVIAGKLKTPAINSICRLCGRLWTPKIGKYILL